MYYRTFCGIFSVKATVCFSPTKPFPEILGGLESMTQYSCVGYDSTNSRVIVGGYSNSLDMVSLTSKPILV
jgi:hypothetical protein